MKNIILLVFFVLIELIMFFYVCNKLKHKIKSLKIFYFTGIILLLTGIFSLFNFGYIELIFIPLGTVLLIIYFTNINNRKFHILLFTFFILIADLYVSNTYSWQNDVADTQVNSTIIEQNTNLIDKAYYEMQDSAFFTLDTLKDQTDNLINYYNTAWLIKLFTLFEENISNENKTIIENGSKHISKDINNIDINELYYRSIIINYTKDKYKNSEYLTEALLNKYNEIKSTDEFIKTSYIILNSYKNIKDYIEIPDYIILDIKDKSMTLLKDSQICNLNKQDFQTNIFSGGIIVTVNLLMCDELLNIDHELYEKEYVLFWFNEFCDFINSQNKDDLIIASGIDIFNNLTDLYNLSYKNNSELNFHYNNDIIFNDLQMFYQFEQAKKLFNETSVLNEELLYDTKYWLFNTYPIVPNLREIYYGILLSDVSGYKYNKTKLTSFINKYTEKSLQIDQCYYLAKVFDNNSVSNNLINIIKPQINNLSFENFINLDSYNQYLILYLDKSYDLSFYSSNMKKANSYVLEKYKKCDNEYDFYYMYKILNILNIKFDNNLILDYYNKNLLNKENNNIYSIYRMLEILIINDSKLPDKLTDIFVEYKIDQGGYYTTLDEKNLSAITLRSNYYGFIIDNYLKTGIWINE